MSCLVKMRAVREELSANEKKIADFILTNSALIRDYSSQNLAASVGVSQSSIIKFSQKLNYRGFTDLKLAIHESVVKTSIDGQSDNKARGAGNKTDSIQQQLYSIKNEALLTTIELNDDKRILSAVKVLEKSKRIQIIAPDCWWDYWYSGPARVRGVPISIRPALGKLNDKGTTRHRHPCAQSAKNLRISDTVARG